MPAKFKPSGRRWIKNPETGRPTNRWEHEHHYMKCQSKAILFEYINNSNGKPKIKQKCRNELARRGIKIILVTKES